jgi:hypothetical protein
MLSAIIEDGEVVEKYNYSGVVGDSEDSEVMVIVKRRQDGWL